MQEEDGTMYYRVRLELLLSYPLVLNGYGNASVVIDILLWCVCTNKFLFVFWCISYCSPPCTIYFSKLFVYIVLELESHSRKIPAVAMLEYDSSMLLQSGCFF